MSLLTSSLAKTHLNAIRWQRVCRIRRKCITVAFLHDLDLCFRVVVNTKLVVLDLLDRDLFGEPLVKVFPLQISHCQKTYVVEDNEVLFVLKV